MQKYSSLSPHYVCVTDKVYSSARYQTQSTASKRQVKFRLLQDLQKFFSRENWIVTSFADFCVKAEVQLVTQLFYLRQYK